MAVAVAAVVQAHLESRGAFTSDTEFVSFVQSRQLLRDQVIQAQEALFTNPAALGLDKKFSGGGVDEAVLQLNQVVERLGKFDKVLSERVEATYKAKEDNGKQPPRLLRLSQRLQATPKEGRAIEFILVHYCGDLFPPAGGYSSRGIARNLRLFADFTETEFFQFIAPSRKHIAQGLVEVVEDEFLPDFGSLNIRMPKEVMKALCGARLSDDEYLKIDKTDLAEVLSEEDDFSQAALAAHAHASLEPVPRRESDGDELDEVDMNALLRELGASSRANEGGLSGAESGPNGASQERQGDEEDEDDGDEKLAPYSSDLDYLEDTFKLATLRVRIHNTVNDNEAQYMRQDKRTPEMILRELKAKMRQHERKATARMHLTTEQGAWRPRLVSLAARRGYQQFDVDVVCTLIGATLSQELRKAMRGSSKRFGGMDSFDVGTLLSIAYESLEEQVKHRCHFYKNAPLVRDGVVRLSERAYNSGELADCEVTVDRRMLDFCVGLDTEISEMVEGSKCYLPKITIEQVVLPAEQKKLIQQTVRDFQQFQAIRKKVGFEELLSYGKGMVMLFYGPSGTGKTMMANALANMVGKKLLLVVPSREASEQGLLQFVFREAKIQDALVLIDECEALFESRNNSRSFGVNALLAEIERFDGLLVMCTNRPGDIDEAMHRRITLATEFTNPDATFREKIWKSHIPKELKVEEGVDWSAMASEFDLNGGFIKNAMLSALSFAVSRDPNNVVLTSADIVRACTGQVRGQLMSFDLLGDSHSQPTRRRLSNLVCSSETTTAVREVIEFEKTRKVMSLQWCFADLGSACVLVSGPAGSGKSLVAEVIATETSKSLRVLDCGLLMMTAASGSKVGLETVFKDAINSNSVLVLENAGPLVSNGEVFYSDGGLSNARVMLAAANVCVLKQHVRSYPGIVVLTISTPPQSSPNGPESSPSALANAAARHPWIQWHIRLHEASECDSSMRARLWQTLVPERMPLAADVNWGTLAQRFPSLTGARMRNVLQRAAVKTVARGNAGEKVCMSDLVAAAELEVARSSHSQAHSNMFA